MSTSLNQRIQRFYDQSTQLWLDTWGEHMHHGFYGKDGRQAKDRQAAQLDLIEELLRWSQVGQASRILDAGCGVGGSARYLAKRFGAEALGVTLSPVQVEAARAFTAQAQLTDRVRFQQRDMMSLDAADGPFDLIWSMESAEHIADKAQMLRNFHQLLLPEGRLLLATWCYRTTPPDLSAAEQKLLEKVYRIYNLPPMISGEALAELAGTAGFKEVQMADWSDAVAPFWGEVIRSALEWRNLRLLLSTNWSTIQGAWAMRYMQRGYQQGLIRFVVLQGTR